MMSNRDESDEVDPHQTRHQFLADTEAAPPLARPDRPVAATEADTMRLDHQSAPAHAATSPEAAEGTLFQGDRARSPTPTAIDAGQTLFGKYRVVRRLGGGAMGDVFLVRHSILNRDHALKMIVPHLATHTGALVRFQREFQVMASFHHEHAIEIYDAKLDDDGGYIDMQYVEGRTIAEILAEARSDPDRDPSAPLMPLAWIGRVLGQLCDVLDVAHDAGIVHRDLKPSNLMLVARKAPGREFLKVLDFGIAKIRNDPENKLNDASLTGGFIGTPAYSSPEQVLSKAIDGRSDVYSVGVFLYEVFCGRVPFLGQPVQVMMQQAQVEPSSFAEANPSLRVVPEVERAILRMLAKQPDDRPATARELFEQFAEAVAIGHPETSAWARSHPGFDPSPSAWNSSSFPSHPVEPTEADHRRVRSSGEVAQATAADPGPIAGSQPLRRWWPTAIAAIAAALIASAAVFLSKGPTVEGGSGDGKGKALTVPNRDDLLPPGYLAMQGSGRDDGWAKQVRRNDDQTLYRLFAPGVYLPDEFEVEAPSSGGRPDLVEGWPRVLVRKGDLTGTRYIRMKGGDEFVVGAWDAPTDLHRKDAPAHPAILSGFYIQECEVSNRQLDRFYLANPDRPVSADWQLSFNTLSKTNQDLALSLPAVNVTWREANAYAQSFGAKLPTETQWEYAARSFGQRRRYVWGNDSPRRGMANIDSQSSDVTVVPPRTFQKKDGTDRKDETDQHVYDMAGNVREWCRDVWASYRQNEAAELDPFVNQGGPGAVARRAIRGCGFDSPLEFAQTSQRDDSLAETEMQEDLGFRVVIECPDIPIRP